MSRLDTIVGRDLNFLRKHILGAPVQFTPNATVSRHLFAVPVGLGESYRIEAVAVSASAVPLDADGTMLLNVKVNDISEGATDLIVSGQDLEILVTAANRCFDCTLVAETAAKERIIEPGDVVFMELVNNSAAIDTNPFVLVHLVLFPLWSGQTPVLRRRGSY